MNIIKEIIHYFTMNVPLVGSDFKSVSMQE